MKPAIDDKPPSLKKSVDTNGYFMNNKKRNSFKKYMEEENEKMSTRILKIMNSPRREIEVQGYSKYHCVKRSFIELKGKEMERQRSIEKSNVKMGERIVKMKPDVGSVKEWNEHYVRWMNDSKIVRRKKEENKGEGLDGSVVGRNGSVSCLEYLTEDRSNEKEKEKINESEKLNKFGAIKSEKLPYLPDLESHSLKRKLSIINSNKAKARQPPENEEDVQTSRDHKKEKEVHTTRTEQIYRK